MNIVDKGSDSRRSMLEETDAEEHTHIWRPAEKCMRVSSNSLIIEDG